MDISAGPAALGGVMMCVALAAWALGRWQGGISPSFDAAVPQDAEAPAMPGEDVQDGAAIPHPHAAQAQRQVTMHTEASLGEVHAEITAYRRAERVLCTVQGDAVDYGLQSHAADCRHIGVSGLPTGAHPNGGCGDGCGAAALSVEGLAQPSPPASGFTRV